MYELDYLYYGQHHTASAETPEEMRNFILGEIVAESGSVYGAVPCYLVEITKNGNTELAARGKETDQGKLVQMFIEAIS
jgi:hypothetical protein